MNGILNIDKPYGLTSFDVVARVRRMSGQRKVGHAGTLDPAATGVLLVCLGRATRVIEFLMEGTKAYRAEIEFGAETDSYDATGEITQRKDPSGLRLSQIEKELPSFTGSISQAPPPFSAVKFKGKPLYSYARAGIDIETKTRPVRIDSLEITGWDPPVLGLDIVCGKGTYIRSLAHDLGRILGCGAHLKSLVRTRCGDHDIADARSLGQLEEAFAKGDIDTWLHPPDSALIRLERVELNEEEAEEIRNGRPLPGEDITLPAADEHPGVPFRRAYTPEGRFLGILRPDAENGVWKPYKVFL